MTFAGKLRLTLLLAALLPSILITIIVIIGLPAQIRRVEVQQEQEAVGLFRTLLDSRVSEAQQTISYVAGSREFQMMELARENGHVDSKYRLPLLTLDFLEYFDTAGTTLYSADRPAMIGQLDFSVKLHRPDTAEVWYWFEHDLKGSHPAAQIIVPTEAGILVGGIYLDGPFQALAEAMTRSTIRCVNKLSSYYVGDPGEKYLFDPGGGLYFMATFHPADTGPIFTNFLIAIGAVTLFSLLLVIPAGLYFSARTNREIELLSDGAVRVAKGDFSQPIPEANDLEFSRLAESFNHMMRQLDDYRAKLIMSEKIAAWQSVGRKVAHEVKNPLTPIAIAADDLRRSYEEGRPDFKEILESSAATIRHEVDRLKKLIDQFASFARMPAPEIVAVEVKPLVDELAALFVDDISKGKLSIENRLAQNRIHCDPDQIRQAVINLIKNSFEGPCGHCVLTLAREADVISITIADDGPGFPKKILDEGIVPYYTTKKEGGGMGLLICQRIAFDHGGQLIIRNKSEGGAEVTITLPHKDA
jgi:signal transduction histidine kinase